MKKSFILGAVIASFVLSSCSLFKTYSTESKDLDLYLLDSATVGGKKIEECKLGSINTTFINGEGYIPCFSLEQYASLYQPYFENDVKSEVTTEGTTSTWTIYRGEELYFVAMVSSFLKTIMTAGSISSVLATDTNPSDYSVIKKFTNFTDSIEHLTEQNYAEYKFSSYSFKVITKNSKKYYPLGLLDNAFSEASGLYHFYNYKNLYVTWDVENFSKNFKTSTGETSVDKEMESVTAGQTIPQYLLDYNASCFLFTLDNFYGLKSYYKIDSMKSYFSRYTFYSDLYSTNGEKRGIAYSSALALFDDHHTGLVSANNAWGEGKTAAIGGESVIKRQYQNKELSRIRKETFMTSNQYTVSTDHKTVLYYFDSFDLGTKDDVFNPDGTVRVTAYEHDSYYNLLQHLQQFEKDSRIENVIIDVSTNGGGIIAVMAKMLALISKDNKGIVSLMDENTGVVDTSTCQVDVNMDGQYTADEVYGNKFNFYIMTSNCSFSCGNAFPYYAQKMGIKTVGEKSGGGECAVGIHYMPNSEYVYHSSMTHIGYYDAAKKEFTGFESGAKPDISLVNSGKSGYTYYDDFGNVRYSIPDGLYNVNKLSTLLN